MAAITDYASLTSNISDWAERTYTAAQTDMFIGLAEAEFRLYFGPHFAKEQSTTALAFTSGSAAQPSGFIRAISLLHTTYGSLTESSIGTIRERRVADTTGSIPYSYAVTGSTIELDAAAFTGNLTLDYEATLSGLSASNTTNWLITNAPQAYLAMCLSMCKAREEVLDMAAAYRQSAIQTLSDLSLQSTVAQLGGSTINIPGATP